MKKLNGFVALVAAVTLMFGIVSCNSNAEEPKKPVTYSVTVSGGTANPAVAEAGATITITANTPETGKGFDTWTTTNDGVTFANAKAKETTFIMPAGAVSVTATYKNLTYSVTLNANGGTFADGKNITSYIYGTAVTLPTKDDITKDDFDFAGWFTNEECTGEPVTQITATDTQAKTFWAKWTEKPRTAASGKIGIYEAPYKVGDIVFKDGSVTPYTDGMNLTSEQKAAAIALIFYVGTDLNSEDDTTTSRTLGVGLKHSSNALAWCTKTAAAYDKKIETIKGDKTSDDKNGSNNLEQISTFLKEAGFTDDTATAENYPAFYFAKNYMNVTGSNVSGTDYETGWYLPTVAELNQIYLNGKGNSKVFDVDAASDALGGDKFESSWYCSSSLFFHPNGDLWVYKFHFSDANLYGGFAYSADDVCCIREF